LGNRRAGRFALFRRILAWLMDLLRLFLIALLRSFIILSALNPEPTSDAKRA